MFENAVEQLKNLFGQLCKEELEREFNEKEYLNQEDFLTCADRRKAAMNNVYAKMNLFIDSKIINHRECKHGEDRSLEKNNVLKTVETKYSDSVIAAKVSANQEPDFWI